MYGRWKIGTAGEYTLRRDEKCAEVIDGQRVVRRPLRRRVRNPLKKKGMGDISEWNAESAADKSQPMLTWIT